MSKTDLKLHEYCSEYAAEVSCRIISNDFQMFYISVFHLREEKMALI